MSEKPDRAEEFKELFYKNIINENDVTQDFMFNWNIPYPHYVKKLENGTHQLEWSGKSNRDYVNQNNEPTRPLVGIARMFSHTHFDRDPYYQSAYGHYKGKIRTEVISILKQVDKSLEDYRLSTGEITLDTQHRKHISIGTFRVFNGSRNPYGLANKHFEDPVDMKVKDPSEQLPFQRLNSLRTKGALNLEIDKKLDRLRNQGVTIFEVGKFSLSGTPEQMSRARTLIEMFWLSKFAEQYPDAVFVGHVVTPAHVRLYQSRYGFKVAETYEVPNYGQEHVLIITGSELAARLRQLTGLSDPGYVGLSSQRKSSQ